MADAPTLPLRVPEGLRWSAATAAFQVEGARTADGRGRSIWDDFVDTPGNVRDGSTAEPGPDSYHRNREDVALLRDLGVDRYRFSISWVRVQPDGRGPASSAGLAYYDRLVDGLLAEGITPFPTLYHWDLPSGLEAEGGWLSRDTAERFAAYAEGVAAALGDRVKHWYTINEPVSTSLQGYAVGELAPGRQLLFDSLPTGIGTALLLPDPLPTDLVHERSRAQARAPWRERLGALQDRNFGWVLASRLTVNLGNALGTALLLFFLLYGVGSPAASAEDDLLVLIVIYTIFVVGASLFAGSLSDRTGVRKPIVIVAALVQAASAVMILISPTFIGTAVAAAVMGAGYGAYMAVSLALATDLLPRPEHHARDLGIVNVSANLGQLLGPLLGAGLVALVGGFWLLFLVAGILSVLGGIMTVLVHHEPVRPDASSRSPRRAAR